MSAEISVHKNAHHSEEVRDFCKKISARHGAQGTLVIAVDEDGHILALGSDCYPEMLEETSVDEINAALAQINAGKGLQS